VANDPLSAALEEIRERRKLTFHDPAGRGRPELILAVKAAREDVPRLLAALDEVLKTAGEWEASSDARPLTTRGYAAECFRAAITRGLTGQAGNA
jgi:hypothetical protein